MIYGHTYAPEISLLEERQGGEDNVKREKMWDEQKIVKKQRKKESLRVQDINNTDSICSMVKAHNFENKHFRRNGSRTLHSSFLVLTCSLFI